MKFEKTYLSRAMTRAMAAHGMPIGDPTGGPAYGERRDPVSAIMAVASMWEAGTIIAGASTLMAGFEALTVAQGLMFAGGALSLVGNVTGNKDLMVLGSVVSLTGGYGRFFADEGSFFNQTFSDAFTPSPSAPTANLSGSPVSSDLAPGAQNVGTQRPLTEPLGGFDSTAPRFETSSPASAQSVNTPMDGQSYFPPAAAPAAPQPLTYATENVLPLTPEQVKVGTSNTFGQTLKGPPVDPGIIDKAMAFAKENPMAAMVLGQAAGGVATGVMDMASGKTAAQTDQLRADAAYRQSIADKTNKDSALQASRLAQMKANIKGQYPQMGVTANAVTFGQQPPAGLINTARG